MKTELTIDETHVYRLGGVELPGVTQVINSIAPQYGVDNWYLKRGSILHKCIYLLISKDLDEKYIDPCIKGKLEAAKSYINDFIGPDEYLQTEAMLHSERFQFAGSIDLLTTEKIVDWKQSKSHQSFLQVGAYSILAPRREAHVVILRDSGKYKLNIISEPELNKYANLFKAFLTVYHWKNKHSLI